MSDINELRFDTVRAGRAGEHAASLNAQCLGRWISDFGLLNQVITLARPDQEERSQPEWLIQREVIRLRVAKPWSPSDLPLIELREYAIFSGHHDHYMALMLEAIKGREKYSPNLGIWVPLSGDINRVFHISAYRDLQHRDAARAESARDPDWMRYLNTVMPMLRQMRNSLLLPYRGH